MTNLSNFRKSFINAQNKADFSKSGKELAKEFRFLQMDENGNNQNDTDEMTLFVSKKKIVIFWILGGKTYSVTLNKEISNKFDENAKVPTEIFKEKISIYDTKLIEAVVKQIGDIFLGENWYDLYNLY